MLLAREMGWTVDHVLDMGITRFNEVSKVVSEFYKEQERNVEVEKAKSNFGGM